MELEFHKKTHYMALYGVIRLKKKKNYKKKQKQKQNKNLHVKT